MQSIDNSQFETILQEANAHYDTGRFTDAAKTFEHLSSVCIKEERFEDMLYFSYRALKAWDNTDNFERMIKLYQKIGILTLKFSTKLAIDQGEGSTDAREKARLFNIAQANFALLGEKERRLSVVEELLELYKLILKNTDNYSSGKEILVKMINMAKIMNDMSLIEKYSLDLSKLIEKEGDYQLKNASFDAEEIASRLYKQAIDVFRDLDTTKMEKRIVKIQKKIENNRVQLEN